jgi:two-component system sensor histidine kinase YesM
MLLPLLVVGIISYRYYYQAVWESTVMAADHAIMNLAREMEQVISAAGQFLEIGSYMASERYLTEQGDSYSSAKEILALMQLYRGRGRSTPDIKDIYLVGMNGLGISEREGVFRLRVPFKDIPALEGLRSGKGEGALLRFYRRDISGYWDKSEWQARALTETSSSLGLGRPISYSIRQEVIGVSIVEINPARIDAICREQSDSGDIAFSVYDANAGLMFGNSGLTSSPEWRGIWRRASGAPRGQFVHPLSGENFFFVYFESRETGLRIIGQASLDVIMERAYRIKYITAASVLGGIIFTMLLYAFVSERVTKPIKELQGKMHLAAQGDMEVRFNSRRSDEIADLGNSFNIMIERIKNLMLASSLEQENLKKAEFRALQAQINPHFLYNTLDSIVWMSQASKHEEVMTMAVALSRFFRLTLNRGREIVAIGEEVEHAKNYLIIQRMRYAGILDFEISADPMIARYRMIKLTLQPLIENAIYHGLKTKRGGGKIWVNGSMAGGMIAFTIRDDGSGMSPERLEEVISEMRGGFGDDPYAEHGYALRNVRERMRLFYGDRSDLSIESAPSGTTVKMVFPAMESEGENV